MILRGERIVLRPLKDSDFNFFFKWHSDPEIRFLTTMHPFPVTEKMERDWFDNAVKDYSNKRVIFVIEENDSSQPIGYFQFTEINYINRNAMLGIVIGEKAYQGKGLGKEIMELGINYGFMNLNLKKINLLVLEINANALKLYTKLGFNTEGRLLQNFFFSNEYYNVLSLGLIRNE